MGGGRECRGSRGGGSEGESEGSGDGRRVEGVGGAGESGGGGGVGVGLVVIFNFRVFYITRLHVCMYDEVCGQIPRDIEVSP